MVNTKSQLAKQTAAATESNDTETATIAITPTAQVAPNFDNEQETHNSPREYDEDEGEEANLDGHPGENPARLVSNAPSHTRLRVAPLQSTRSRSPLAMYRSRPFQPPQERLRSDGKNYKSWKLLMERALRPWKDLLYAELSEDQLETNELDGMDWELQQNVLNSIEMSILDTLPDFNTASDLWYSLCEHFEEQYDLESANYALHSTFIGPKDSIKQHLEKMNGLLSSYKQAGGIISENHWLRVLKNSLSSSSRRDVRVDVKRSEHTSVAEFTKFILVLDDPRTGATESSLTVNSSRPMQQKSMPNLRNCENCQGKNHNTSQCRSRGGAMETKCVNCNKFGHTIDNCYSEGGGAVNRRPSNFVSRINTSQPTANIATVVTKSSSSDDLLSRYKLLEARLAMAEQKLKETENVPQAFAAATSKEYSVSNSMGTLGVSFICDGGASQHMVKSKELFHTFEPFHQLLSCANPNAPLYAEGRGSIIGRAMNGHTWTPIRLDNVLYVPSLARNLFSMGAAIDHGAKFDFNPQAFTMSLNDVVVASGFRANDKLYWFTISTQFKERSAMTCSNAKTISLKDLHRKAAHINTEYVMEAIRRNRVLGVTIDESKKQACTPCMLTKMTKMPSRPRIEIGTSR
jgi:hypothetical protein